MKTLLEKFTKAFGKTGLFITLAVVLIVGIASAQIIYDLRNGISYVNVVSPKTSGAADTSSAIDVGQYVGKVVFIQNITGAKGTSVTYTAKIQHSTDSTTWAGSTSDSAFADFTSSFGTNTGTIVYKTLDTRKVRRYLRYITTMSASDSVSYGVLLLAQSRYR